jgi:hypothetical protein
MMTRLRYVFITAVLLLAANQMFGQATRTWVSGVGDDVNPCSRTAPCKTFAGAISKTAAGGEINVLDPGGFGAVTITKSITIDGGGTFASILASGTQGVVISAASTDMVVLRNLSINGSGTTLGTNGVKVNGAGKVLLEHVYIQSFSTSGINISPTSLITTAVTLNDVTVNNTTSHGIQAVNTNAATIKLSMTDCQVKNTGGNGIFLSGATVKASVQSTSSSYSAGAGLAADTSATADVHGSSFSFNANGLQAGNSAVIRFWGSQVNNNTTNGLNIFGAGAINSHGNNAVQGNGGNSTPTANISTQ